MKITKEKMDELAELYHFKLSEEEKDLLLEDFERLNKGLEILKKIDTKGVEPMAYVFDDATEYMRDDDSTEELSKEEVLKNAPKSKDNFFVVPRVVE